MIAAALVHADALAAIHRHAFPPGEEWSRDAFATQLAMPGVFGLVDPRGGLILARIAADEAEILTLAVLPAMRRHGVGRALLGAALDHASACGAVAAFLEVAEANGPARHLYEILGFETVGHRVGYYGPGNDAVVLRRALPRSE